MQLPRGAKISSLLIALRLHPSIVSTSISPRAVGDVRSYIRVMGLREGCEGWVNAEGVRWAVECVVGFRVRFVRAVGEGGKLWSEVWEEVWRSVKAPF